MSDQKITAYFSVSVEKELPKEVEKVYITNKGRLAYMGPDKWQNKEDIFNSYFPTEKEFVKSFLTQKGIL